jgi:hypothetical protein
LKLASNYGNFNFVVIIITVCIFTSICQKFAILKLKENAQIDMGILWINFMIVISGYIYLIYFQSLSGISVLSDFCS